MIPNVLIGFIDLDSSNENFPTYLNVVDDVLRLYPTFLVTKISSKFDHFSKAIVLAISPKIRFFFFGFLHT